MASPEPVDPSWQYRMGPGISLSSHTAVVVVRILRADKEVSTLSDPGAPGPRSFLGVQEGCPPQERSALLDCFDVESQLHHVADDGDTGYRLVVGQVELVPVELPDNT
jgi:hypothetical protein